ncbi:MAG: hypothetical protein ACRD0A_02125 [Acidimicrobiales bacterium]
MSDGILSPMTIQAAPARRAATATQQDTILALLERSKRRELPIRKTFLQQGRGRVRTPGPLASLVRNHDERALDLYLLVHAVCSGEGFDVTMPAGVWARSIGLANTSSGRSTISKAFRRLDELGLIERARDGSRAKATLLDEGGHGGAYDHPGPAKQPYLKVPYPYWEDGWHLKLDLRAKAVLLIALSLDDGFVLPIERAPDWYGISADTTNRGLLELRDAGLLDLQLTTKTAPLAPEGIAQEYHYTLQAPFGPMRQPIATVTKLKQKKVASS